MYQMLYIHRFLSAVIVCSYPSVKGLRLLPSTNLNAEKSWCSSEQEYITGEWVFNESPNIKFPFTVDPDPVWQPTCDAVQKKVLAGGPIPKYLRYQWKPKLCDLETLNPEALCAKMNGQTIGMVGDSTSQQFWKTFTGLMLGHWSKTADTGARTITELCPNSEHTVRLLWHRLDNWPTSASDFHKLISVFNESDVVVLNWGPHYLKDAAVRNSLGFKQKTFELEESLKNLSQLIQEHWLPKPTKHIFWRASMSFIPNCDKVEEPFKFNNASATSMYNVDLITKQEHTIVWPKMRDLGATILRTDAFTALRPDGHRGKGHGGGLDCLHYCEPGPQITWLHLFSHYLMGHVTH